MPSLPTTMNTKLTDHQKNVIDALRRMGALNPDKARGAEDIVKLTRMPKGRVLSVVQELENLRLLERAHTHKQHKYFLRA